MADRVMPSISSPRGDGAAKRSGRAKYLADVEVPGLLYAKTVRSPLPHARIRAILLPELPGGYDVVDRNDVPGRNRVKMLFDDQPLFAEETVRYTGEPVLLVVGPDREVLSRLAAAVRIDYEPLDPFFDVAAGAGDPERAFADYLVVKGSPDEAFSSAALIVTEDFETGIQEQFYLEPQGATAVYEGGRITVYASMQCPYYVKNALVQAFGWPADRVRAVQTATGGAFGGKEDYPSILACQAAVASYKTGRPVRLVLERGEDLAFTPKRHPSRTVLKAAISEAGELLALDADIVLDAGAYTGLSSVVLQRALFALSGVYDIPNCRARGRAVLTNNPPEGCFRGFGAPQAFFAVESFMNHLAERLGKDPVEFRRPLVARKGGKTLTGGTFHDEVPALVLLERALAASGYAEKHGRYAALSLDATGGRTDLGKRLGIGFSVFLHGCGFTGSGERDHIKAKVRLEKKGGRAVLRASSTEMGQGASTTLRKIVAGVLGLPVELTVYENPDTDAVPDSGPTVASRTAMIVGGLFERAARKMKERWSTEESFSIEESYVHPSHVIWEQDTFSGDAYQAFSWGVNVVEIALDPVTFEVETRKAWAFHDVGRAADELIVRGQAEGGLVQGLGFAGLEVMETANGRMRQATAADYCIPTAADVPDMETGLVDNPYEHGPSGAKGVGELTIVGAAPAYAMAVENALGLPIHRVPVRPEDLIDLWAGRKGAES